MSKNIRIIYLYIVSFISLVMVVAGLVSTVNAIASYCYPVVYYYGNSNADIKTYSEGLEIRTRNEKRSSIKEGISYSAVTIVGGCLFAYHWNKIQNERKEEEK